MTKSATPIKDCYVPSEVYALEGTYWMEISINGDYESYRAMPNGLTYEGKTYRKTAWNSDTGRVYYREGSVAQ